MQFTNGQRVRYKGTLVPRLTGQEGTFRKIGRNGWAEVDFDRDGDGVKVAPDNLEAISPPISELLPPIEKLRGPVPTMAEVIASVEASAGEYRRCAKTRPETLSPIHFADLLDGIAASLRAISPKKPILAKIDVQAAGAVADFLDNEAANNTNAAPWAIERATVFGEVADALRALTNDTDAIVTDFNDL